MNFHNHTALQAFAICIKDNVKLLSAIGLIFFLAATLFGVYWLVTPNNDKLEPITFILGACSTIFFGLPQLAEFIVPNRKAIRHMTYDEIIEFVLTTDTVNDWHDVDRELIEERFLKEDPRLRFVVKFTDEGTHNDDYQEGWATGHFDPHAESYYYYLLFDSNYIHRIILVSVDGGRARLPVPNLQSMKVDPFDYKVAQIYDSMNTLDEYMRRSRIHL